MNDAERQRKIQALREHDEKITALRAELEAAREEWAAQEQPELGEWMSYVGDDPGGWATSHLMQWMRETGRKMG